ncbi:MAG: S41 family peptidase [Phycisphaerales bacterium JB054]
MRGVMLAWCVAAVAACVSGPVLGQVSPFEDVEWSDAGLERVMVNGKWWEPVAIAGVEFEALYAFALEEYGRPSLAQKRVDEDLLDVFARMGSPLGGESVSLALRDPETGLVVGFDSVQMTREQRNALRDKRDAIDEAAERARVVRSAAGGLDSIVVESVLLPMHEVLRTMHSYSAARGVDLDAVIASERSRLGDGASLAELSRSLRRVLAKSGDGHARVSGMLIDGGLAEDAGRGLLPVAVLPVDLRRGGRVVAQRDGRLLSPGRPYLTAIDGVEIERWLGVAAEVAPGGSAASERYGACREVGRVGWIRERLGIEAKGLVRLTLADEDGNSETVELELADRPERDFRKQAGRESASVVESVAPEIAYIAIESMYGERSSPEEFAAVHAALGDAARGASGVILDIRGNTGGSRDLTHLVASYVMAPGDDPVVYSAARVLMWPGREPVEEGLEGRYLRRPESSRWSDAERAAIDRFLEGFAPEVALDDDRFGPLHVSVLSPGGPGAGALAGIPVVVLIDERCISASDIFAAAMKVLPRVRLVGRPTRGASGMSVEQTLGRWADVKISTMVSFMADGRLFDWHGIEPDIAAAVVPGDFTRQGSDTALAEAIRLVQEMSAEDAAGR